MRSIRRRKVLAVFYPGVVVYTNEETGVCVDADAAVVALALLLENPPLQIRAMRPYPAAHWRANPTLAAELRRPAHGRD